mmetsp:Transcript_62637/g.153969  ORF Transcript_62637/g.153969 Transcript_62637/m.153969 type:complete len:236 (+) Transcript_62637:1334-2041(+)
MRRRRCRLARPRPRVLGLGRELREKAAQLRAGVVGGLVEQVVGLLVVYQHDRDGEGVVSVVLGPRALLELLLQLPERRVDHAPPLALPQQRERLAAARLPIRKDHRIPPSRDLLDRASCCKVRDPLRRLVLVEGVVEGVPLPAPGGVLHEHLVADLVDLYEVLLHVPALRRLHAHDDRDIRRLDGRRSRLGPHGAKKHRCKVPGVRGVLPQGSLRKGAAHAAPGSQRIHRRPPNG